MATEGDGRGEKCDAQRPRRTGTCQKTLWNYLDINRKRVHRVQKGYLLHCAPQLLGCIVELVLEYAWSVSDYYEHWFLKRLTFHDLTTDGNSPMGMVPYKPHYTHNQHT